MFASSNPANAGYKEAQALLTAGDAEAGAAGGNPGDAGGFKTHKTVLGTEVIDDDADWQYVMVFKRVETRGEVVEEPFELLKSIFEPRVLEPWADQDVAFWEKVQQGGMNKGELFDGIFQKVLGLLTSTSCGFTVGLKPTLDETKLMLLIKLRNPDTVRQLADRLDLQLPVTEDSYSVKGLDCPKAAPTLGQKFGWNKQRPPSVPVYIKYETTRNAYFRAAAHDRLQAAGKHVDSLLSAWSPTSAASKALLRRLVRLQDARAATMVIMVEMLTDSEQKKDAAHHAKLVEVFTLMNEILEHTDPDMEFEMKRVNTDKERLAVRIGRWSPPNFPSKAQFLEAQLYGRFQELDVLRLVRQRIRHFLDIASMEREGVIDSFWTAHHYKDVEQLTERWASIAPGSFLQWPGEQHTRRVRDYFGEEVGFFFHWLAYQTRLLFFPAGLSVISLCLTTFIVHDDRVSLIRDIFAFVMCGWVAFLTASYNQASTSNNIVWGMQGYADRAQPQSSYHPELRGSCKESVVRALHWVLVVSFVVQTIISAGMITNFRSHALEHPEGVVSLPFGVTLENSIASQLGLYLVTINIKVMNGLWGVISPKLSNLENWRTYQDQKNNQVSKTFMVKCVVNYYPFFYLAFLRDFVEGCDGDECVTELRKNLAVFIVTHTVTVVVNVLVQLASTWWTESSMRQKVAKTNPGAKYTYLQAQAIWPEYESDTDDYMELCIMLGFISMFSVVYPFLAFLALASNLIELRVLAFRMCRVLRRPVPRGQEGIGAWLGIMKVLTCGSCITSVGLCIFTLNPIKKYSLTHKLAGFVIAEHLMLLLIFAVGKAVPPRSSVDEIISESHEAAEGMLLDGDSQEVKAEPGTVETLYRGVALTPGKAIG